ncbi:fibroblast growth factor 2-like [Porites lutea]|uniref:fibroblast growth factor 2-like n=1 Tax=Porites lutea TaxID=51062 RepID=UPI003CC6D4D2
MAKEIFMCWIIYLIYLSSCLALPMKEISSFSGDTQALENSGINPKHVVNNHMGVWRYKRVYSRNSGKFLRMYNGTIDGLGDKHDPNVKIMMESVGTQIILKSYDGSVCICVDDHGAVIARPSQQARNDSACEFYHNVSPKGYTTFRSYFNPSWYLGITRHGQAKSAKKTRKHQRAAHFMDMN